MKTAQEIKQAWRLVTTAIDSNTNLWSNNKQRAYQAASFLKDAALSANEQPAQGEGYTKRTRFSSHADLSSLCDFINRNQTYKTINVLFNPKDANPYTLIFEEITLSTTPPAASGGEREKEEMEVLRDMYAESEAKLTIIKKAYEQALKSTGTNAALKIISMAMDSIDEIENMK